MADNLSQLLATPLQPLREQWRSPAQAELLRTARERHEQSPDACWAWVAETPLLETLRTARGQGGPVEHTIVVDRTGRGVPLAEGEISYADALTLAPEGIPAVPLEANDPAFLIFTSGTEAQPKGVVHSVAGFLIGTWANVRWQVGPEDGDVYRVAAGDIVEHGAPQGDTSAMDDVAGLQAVQQAVQQAGGASPPAPAPAPTSASAPAAGA